MEWRKPSDKRFTDLCIWIDANLDKLKNPGEYPEIENKIYNYLWLLIKALAIKKNMFKKFDDYDPYAFYAADKIFFAFRKNLQNQGKKIKGKEIKPIKSCLNYTKAVLHVRKIEYLRETYKEILDEEFTSKQFNAIMFKQQLQESVRQSQGGTQAFIDALTDTFEHIDIILDRVLEKSPFNKNMVEYKKLKISLMLNCNATLTTKKKLGTEPATIILWKLPKSLSSYVRILLKEFYMNIKQEILDCYNSSQLDSESVDHVLSYKEGQDYNYESNN